MRKVFDFILFTGLFIACCAVVMVFQSYTLIIGKPVDFHFSGFVFFSTVCSYNFHWALTPHSLSPSQRLEWDEHHKKYHLLLSFIGLTGSIVFFIFIKEHWFYIGVASLLTFLYSAPKVSYPPLQWLKKIAIGKTVFLALAWAYVTAALPVLVEGEPLTLKIFLFCLAQFFYIYAICILFDFRDRDDDKADGIKSMITFFNEKGINAIFFISVIVFSVLCFILKQEGFSWLHLLLLLLPAFILVSLFKTAKRNFSDYLYYFVLDGLMMLSGLLLWIVNMF